MADRRRLRYDLFSTVLGTTLTSGSTTIEFANAPPFKTLGSNEMVVLTINDVEIVHLTSYTAAATTGTVERGQEGTSDVTHLSGVSVRHAPTTVDFKDPVRVFPLLASPDGTLWGIEADSGDGSLRTHVVPDVAGETDADYASAFALVASDDSTWSVTVSNAGALATDQTTAVTTAYDYARGPGIPDNSGSHRRLGVSTAGVLFAYGGGNSRKRIDRVEHVSAAFTCDSNGDSDIVLADADAGTFAVTLPSSPDTGRVIEVKKISPNANNVTIETPGAETIDGAANYTLPNQYDHVALVFGGTNWFTI